MKRAPGARKNNFLLQRHSLGFLLWRRDLLRTLAITTSIGLSLLGLQRVADAQLTILHSFGDGSVPKDGIYPLGGLVQASNGSFFGVTSGRLGKSGEERYVSTAFQLVPGGGLTIIISFVPNKFQPEGPLLVVGEKLIGFSPYGPFGRNGEGNDSGGVFELAQANSGEWKRSYLHIFLDGTVANDGQQPRGPLIVGSDNDFYGTTSKGGIHDAGTIYKIHPGNNKVTILHRFQRNSTSWAPATGLLLGKDGNYYGTTELGRKDGAANSIFKMTPRGNVTTIYTSAQSEVAAGSLIQDSEGNFYGATAPLGIGFAGTVFKMTPDYTVTILHSFGSGTDGSNPAGALVLGPDGNLYGLTQHGGTAGGGTIYQLSTDGSSYNVLHSFRDGSVPNDGIDPSGQLIVGADNKLYGETREGGAAGYGTIFSFAP